ncbi:MAG: YjdF family protein [Ruminococcus sp.]|nr:YjdF family protein [Ruminococcus sp.]
MGSTHGTFTVFFDGQFWTGIFEIVIGDNLTVCKVTFGAEPVPAEIYGFIINGYSRLKFSPEMTVTVKKTSGNPKRIQREVRKQMQNIGISTKSQQALKLQQESMKVKRNDFRKVNRENKKQYQFELRQQKKKSKHKGH